MRLLLRFTSPENNPIANAVFISHAQIQSRDFISCNSQYFCLKSGVLYKKCI